MSRAEGYRKNEPEVCRLKSWSADEYLCSLLVGVFLLLTQSMATIDDFNKIDIRVGKVLAVEDFPEARKPAYKLTIDFGPDVGIKRSSGQFTKHHTKDELLGKLVLGIVNFPPRQIGPFTSESLTLGVPDSDGEAILVVPSNEHAVVGGKLF